MTTARASRQERTDGRTGKVCSALITAATLLGCTENQAATTDVHNGTGIVTPNVIVTDPAVPGGKVASVEVDDVAIEPLRMHLANLFAPDDVEAHAVIVFNPTLVPLGCTAGPGRACLRVRLNAEGVSILPGLTDIQTDSSRVSLPTFMTPLEVNDLNTVGFDLTPLDAKGQVDTKSSFYRLSRYLHDDDAEVRLKLRADELKLESRGGRAGLWMAGTLTIDRNVAHWCKETAQGTYESTLPLSDCEEILTKMNDELEDYVTSPTCHRVNVYLVMGQVHFWLGLIPDADAGCSPVAFRPDLDWMQYAPAGRSYQQGCLRVTPEVRVFAKVDPLKIGQDWDGDIGVLASVAQCSTAVDLWCGNCMTLASEKAAPQVQARLNNEVKKSLEQQIGPFFAYQGGQTSPYAAAALPGTACNPISDTACQAQVRKHDLPASVTRLAFGWFANAFGDFSTSASPGQYPVVRVRTNPSGCPPGSSLAVHATTADRCVACPLPCEYSANHDSCRDTILDLPCATLFSTAVESVALDYAIDPDADGIPQPQDNCPGAWNPVQTDQDGDGLGAACETCDCDNAPNPDPDHDGICTNACNAQGDNCPHIANGGQENCNVDAEIAREAEILGDACDPVPCPAFEPVMTVATSNPKSWYTADVKVKVALDYLTIKPIGSHVRNASVATEVPTQVQATHYRYCIHAPEFPTKVNCFDDKAVIDDLKLNEVKIWELENTSTWWHRVQMAGLVQLPQSKPPPIGAPDGPLVYGAGEYSRVWNWPSDFERWHGSAWGAWVPDASTAFKTDDPKFLPPQGRFWIHADGEIGTVDLTLGTGMHGKKDALADPAESLANHYQPIAPFSSWVLKQAPTKPIFVYRECYLCGPPIKPSGDMCPNCSMEIMPELPSVVSRVIASTPDGTVGVTSRSGALIPLRADPAAYLMQSLALGPVWVDQAEPSAYLGKSRSAPIAVGIDPSSGALVEQVFVAAGRLLGAADLRSTDEVPGIAVQSSLEASPGRTGFVPVYSRALSRVFLVGGTDETGAIASDIVWKSLDAAPWQHVPTGGYVPGHVLAATYHAADNMLWILDEVGALTEGARVRLTRLDPVSGKGELLGEWPRMNNFTEYWLRSDRDGSMLAFASSDKTHSHAIARLSAANASLTAIGFKVRAGALVEAPVVDMAGYWLTREQGNKKRQVERLTELPLLEVGWLDQIGQCF